MSSNLTIPTMEDATSLIEEIKFLEDRLLGSYYCDTVDSRRAGIPYARRQAIIELGEANRKYLRERITQAKNKLRSLGHECSRSEDSPS